MVPSTVRDDYDFYRGFRSVEALAGRREDKLLLLNESGEEDFIHPLLIVEFFIRGMERFQVVCTGPASFTFRVKLQADLLPTARNRVARKICAKWDSILAQKNMRNVRYQVEWTKELSHDTRIGKFRLVDTSLRTEPMFFPWAVSLHPAA